MTEELISFASKEEVLEKSKEFWNPGKTQFWIDSGVPLVIDRREGYFIYDMSGKRLIDVHLNGGTYNLGHRNPEVVAAVTAAMQRFDIGNHHFPSLARTALAEALVAPRPTGLTKVDVRQRRRRGHRHRAEDARGTRRSGARSSRSSRPTTATPGSPSPPATTGSPSCSWPTGPRSSPTCRSTTWTRWRRRCAAATWPP